MLWPESLADSKKKKQTNYLKHDNVYISWVSEHALENKCAGSKEGEDGDLCKEKNAGELCPSISIVGLRLYIICSQLFTTSVNFVCVGELNRLKQRRMSETKGTGWQQYGRWSSLGRRQNYTNSEKDSVKGRWKHFTSKEAKKRRWQMDTTMGPSKEGPR